MDIATACKRRRVVWCIVAALIMVTAGDILFYQQGAYGGQIGFALAALLLLAIACRPAIWRDRRAWVAGGAAAVFAAQMVRGPGPLAWSLFWIAAGMMVLLPTTGRFDDGWRWFQRLSAHAAGSIVAPAIDVVRWRRVCRARSHRRFGMADGLRSIALPAIGSAIIVSLFASANPVLMQWIDALTGPARWEPDVGRMLLWIVLLIGAWSLLHPRAIRPFLGTFDGSGDLPLPGVTIASVRRSLIAFNLLFLVQNAMDVAYLGGLAPMPAGITLADYAHRGAYPLIATALLAALFVLVTLRPGSQSAAVPTIRRLVVLWIVQNLILVASSIVRTVDYVEAYSLTGLRLAALAWMLLVGCGLVFIVWRLLTGRSAGWLINANLAVAGLVLSSFALNDTAAIVASWNARHAGDTGGRGAALDLCYLHGLGGSALPALIELETRPDLAPALRDRVRYVRSAVMFAMDRRIGNGGWTWQDERRLAAARARLPGLAGKLPMPDATRQCDGRIKPPPAPPATVISTLTVEARP
ncbi:hypothetical protein ASE70_13455 [Sphingomonas sp. Leaf22]|uniref:DUF4153 domain-containing protein n=1 Tax=Sphingomonas sp. Leaf22 TaxID=1735687 RepID=UPI0006FDA8A2|nr:DUF4173 domain-containing protein [Sphingomonas sp. Leaf22]KQM93428.1 hypothetical protein ASE70_13455 [Sphingomonas sp. Leaf22]